MSSIPKPRLRRQNARPILLDKPVQERDLIDAHAQKESSKLGGAPLRSGCRHHQDRSAQGSFGIG